MSDSPDRLQEFRAEYRQSGPKFGWLGVALGILVPCMALVSGILAGPYVAGGYEDDRGAGPDRHSDRRLAAYLAEKNQPELALETYEEYLRYARLGPADEAKVCFSVAQLAIGLEAYPKALRYLYEAELLDPDSELRTEIDKKIVLCLEKMGRAESLRRELRTRSTAQEQPSESGVSVLAEFAGETITTLDLEREIEKLPAASRESFSTPEQKTEFLRNLVAERLLLDKAVRLGLDDDPEIQETVARQRDSLIVRKLIDDEVKANLNLSDADVERFYKAEIHLFTKPASARGALGIGVTEEEAQAAVEAPDAQHVTITEGRIIGANLTNQVAKALSDAVLSKNGDAEASVQVGETWYAWYGAVTAAEVTPFESVKDRAAQMYRTRKEQELVQGLIASTLESRNVKLYPERLADEGSAP